MGIKLVSYPTGQYTLKNYENKKMRSITRPMEKEVTEDEHYNTVSLYFVFFTTSRMGQA